MRITAKRATRWPRRVVPAPPARSGSRGRPRPGRWRAATHGGRRRRRRRDVRWRRDTRLAAHRPGLFSARGRAGPRSTERGCPRTPYRSSMASISRAERSEGSAAGNAAANATISSVRLCARRDPGRERSTPPPASASSPPRRPAPAAASSRVRYPPDSCPPDPTMLASTTYPVNASSNWLILPRASCAQGGMRAYLIMVSAPTETSVAPSRACPIARSAPPGRAGRRPATGCGLRRSQRILPARRHRSSHWHRVQPVVLLHEEDPFLVPILADRDEQQLPPRLWMKRGSQPISSVPTHSIRSSRRLGAPDRRTLCCHPPV